MKNAILNKSRLFMRALGGAVLAVTSLLQMAGIYAADAQYSSAVPTMADDWGNAHKEMVADGQTRANDIKIVFAGDSISARWTRGAGKDLWAQRYAPLGAINLSISGDDTGDLLWRLQNGELQSLHPKMVILLIGANNLNQAPDAVAYGVWAVVDYIRKTLPDTRVLVQGIFRRENPPVMTPKAPLVNALISKLDDGKMVKFLDFSSKFLKPDGTLNRTIFTDGCHPEKPEGFQIWADSIQPVVDEWMKEPPVVNVPPPPCPVEVPADKSGAVAKERNDFLFMHKRLVARAAKGNCDLMFLGGTSMAMWNRVEYLTKKEYGPMHWANFALWGTRTQNTLWQLSNGELDGIHPKVVVVQEQDNLLDKTSAEDSAGGVEAITNLIRQKLPDAKVVLEGAFPFPKAATPKDPARVKEATYNDLVAKLADGKSVYFLDVGKAYLGPDGMPGAVPIPAPQPFDPKSFELWAETQRGLIHDLLGAETQK